MKFKGQTALVTGACSGIGKALCEELASNGCNIVLVSNRASTLQEAYNQLHVAYPSQKFYFFLYDLSKTDAVEQIHHFCIEHHIEIQILVNNAGMLMFEELHKSNKNAIDRILHLHIHFPTQMCSEFSKSMVQYQYGYIVNISSISAVMPYPCIALYSGTKNYLRHLSKAIRYELHPFNVHVLCVLPGATDTGLYDPKRVDIQKAKRWGIMQDASYVAKKTIDDLIARKAECKPGVSNILTLALMPYMPSILITWLYKQSKLVSKLRDMLT